MPKIIQETVIRDIVDLCHDLGDHDEVQAIINRQNNKSFSSVTKASSNLVMTFPLMVSRSVSIETATIISKAIERKAATMLQMLFSSMSVTNADNAVDYIKNFHTNMKIDSNMSVDSFVDAMDKFVVNSESFAPDEKQATLRMLNELKNISYAPDNISESGLNNYVVKKDIYSREYYLETKSDKDNTDTEDDNVNSVDYSNLKTDYRRGKDYTDITLKAQQYGSNILLDTDVKKANELVPTMMNIVCHTARENGRLYPINFIVGVKSKIYPIDSADIIQRLVSKHSDRNMLLNFVRATTSEIGFWKDFIFAIDKAKSDAKAQSRKASSSEIWKLLERRALKSRIRRSLSMVNDAPSISTLVVTIEEVDFIKKSYGIDITNPRIVRPIMDSYNLMGFVVVNESMEVANFIFDTGDDIYEQISFNALEREASDNSYKKVVNLISKINR